MTRPWFKFFPADWKADNQLKLCSPAARGLWIEMLCICHEATPYGHFLIQGQQPTDTELSVLTGIPVDQITTLIGELDKRGIFSKTSKGVIYSRKLVRDEKKSSEGKKNGKNGGNPKLSKHSRKSSTLNPKDNGWDNTQKPEARELIYEGKVIRLTQTDFAAKQLKAGMSEDGFVKFLDEKDQWLSTLAEHEQKQWWFRLDGMIKKIAKMNA
jgi:hypothetical protein